MAETGQSGASKKSWWEWARLAGEALTLGLLIYTASLYWRMSNTYEAQLATAQQANVMTQQALDANAKARSEDSAKHDKERAEDQKNTDDANKRADDANKRANEVTQRLLEIQGRVETIRFEIMTINSAFTESFDGAVTNAYKNIPNNNNNKLKDLAQSILDQRKTLRDKAGVVQANMTIIIQALDSLIDELDREINANPMNAERVKTLLRMIYDEKGQIESKVGNAVTVSLNTLGCNAPSFGSELLTIQNLLPKQP
jgi:hypothetical protein